MHTKSSKFGARLLSSAAILSLVAFASGAHAETAQFSIPPQSLEGALRDFGTQSGHALLVDIALVDSKTSRGLSTSADPETALKKLLAGTGLSYKRDGEVFAIFADVAAPARSAKILAIAPSETVSGSAVEGLVVTAQKRRENIQDVPIAISAFTQDQLTLSQIAGGPDLMTQTPNLTFTKTNFSGYSIQIRGIGTQAISATTDAAVAVAFNNTSFIRNRFFEQEFYDLERVEVLRGPQGTLYGRNATAGVVNILSAKPSFMHESKASADVANYSSKRLEGMINLPLVEDKAALRLAGAWTQRDGFVTNEITGDQIDGRDLWSTRLSLRIEPTDQISANLIWEHFEENDDRLRSGKQLCKRATVTEIGGVPVPQEGGDAGAPQTTFSQGCLPASMYSDESYQVPNGFMLPYYSPLTQIGLPAPDHFDPYVSATQSSDLRVIQSTIEPIYTAESDVVQLQLSWDFATSLSLTSETSYSTDDLFSFEDFNRYNTRPGAFIDRSSRENDVVDGVFCDPQLGCADRLVLGDLSVAKSSQFSQEFRLSSDFDGPFNFSLGANFLRYDTEDKYYVFANSLTLWAIGGSYGANDDPYVPGVSDNSQCMRSQVMGDENAVQNVVGCIYVDPNPIDRLNDQGHNYFLSRNPYKLISYAAFGEAYYRITPDLKLTAGLRWTLDKKNAPRIPSWLIVSRSVGYPVSEVVRQDWSEPTGRVAIDWSPDLAFTDQTLLYASYAHGYKAGGMNPPPAVLALYGDIAGLQESLIQPKTFEAEFVDAIEIGTKNTLFDGGLTVNAGAFYYDYSDYQLSQIINRSAVTQNFDATIWGLELEADWRPFENLRLGFKGGYENTRVGDGERAIDLMDRTAGHSDWVVVRPFPTVPSNCILPVWLVTWGGQIQVPNGQGGNAGPCTNAYLGHLDPVTLLPYVPNPTEFNSVGVLINPADWVEYPGFDPSTAPNNGEGFYKDLSGNELPNAPHFTATITADYTIPLPSEWLLTLHTDLYRQSKAWTRVFNFDPYDRLQPYVNVNFAAVLTNEETGWTVMAYVKNVFDKDSITGAFLNSDDTGLTTNVFLTEPRLYGVRITKQWTDTPLWSFGKAHPHVAGEPYALTIELGGSIDRIQADNQSYAPEWADPSVLGSGFVREPQNEDLDWGDGREIKLTYAPDGREHWQLSAAVRYGRTNGRGRTETSTISSPLCGTGTHPLFRDFLCQYHLLDWAKSETYARESYKTVDFLVGKEMGLGSWRGASVLSGGVRYAQLNSKTDIDVVGAPDRYLPPVEPLEYERHWHEYDVSFNADRHFTGAGPALSWAASTPILGAEQTSHVDLEWSLTGGVLFGKQKTHVREETTGRYIQGVVFDLKYNTTPINEVRDRRGNRTVTVPTLEGEVGLSYTLDRLKVGAGYRWERYFQAIDGGLWERKSYDRTIDGPYFKVAIGFGG